MRLPNQKIIIFIIILFIYFFLFLQGYCSTKKNELVIIQDEAMYPNLHNNWLVWGESQNSLQRIHLYDLKNNNEKILNELGYSAIHPSVFEDRLIWLNAQENYSLYITNLNSFVSKKIVSGMVLQPTINGNIVVWTDYRHGKPQIYYYNLEDRIERRLTYNNFSVRQPTTNGKFIAWIEYSKNNYRVCLYDITSEKLLYLSNNEIFVNSPWLSENYLVWIEYFEQKYRVFIYDIKNKYKKEVVSSNNLISYLRGSNKYLVWEEWTSKGPKVMVMEIQSENILPIKSKNIRYSWQPAIDGSKFLMVAKFQDGHNGIYFCNWSSPDNPDT